MPNARVKLPYRSIYHTFTRCTDSGAWMDTDYKKEKFRSIMRAVEQYSGCRVLTYVIMHNHYHILLEQPDPEDIDDNEFMRRLSCLYGENYICKLNDKYEEIMESSVKEAEKWMGSIREKHLARMYDVSEFQKTLKLKYSKWYNTRFKRTGYFWQSRFKSVLVQDKPGALFMMATYIELNPIRKKYVKDVKDYRFCSYGEACGGNPVARANLIRIVGLYTGNIHKVNPDLMDKAELRAAWEDCSSWYRLHIFERGKAVTNEMGQIVKEGFSAEHIKEVLERKGKLTLSESMHCRIRHMTDGVIFGSEEFCEEMFGKFRDMFPEKRKTGSRKIRKVDLDGCCTIRDLQVDAIQPPE